MNRTQRIESTQRRPTPPFKKQYTQPPGLEANLDPKPQALNRAYKGSEKLKGMKTLITGGDSGIGRATAILFAREGADVAFTHLPQEKKDAQKTLKLLEKEGGKSLAIECDLSNEFSVEFIRTEFLKKFKKIDVLVNNAAFQNHVDSIDDLSFEQFKHTFDINIFSYFKLVKTFLPHFTKNASIINTGSILGYEGNENLIDYSATKGAIHSFTKSLAEHLTPKGIRVNSVAPGPVWTPLNPAERKHDDVKDFGKNTLFKRPAQPEEIAPAFVFLASPVTASYITGETLNIFGTISGAN